MKEGLPFFLTSGRHTVKNGLPLQFFNQAGKVADVAADAVQTVDHDGLEFPFLGRGHHLFEVRAVQVAAGKALVLKDNGMFRGSIAVVSADIFAAEVDLISDTFALAGVAGFAGIDGNGVGSFGQEILLMPDETALRELSEQVIEKLKRLTDAEFAGLEFPMN